MNIAEKIVSIIRGDLSDIASDNDKSDKDLHSFVGVQSSDAYNFFLDSLYLMEDTHLAKAAFRDTDLMQQDFGNLYLLYYGLLNACYMQQQAVLIICRELGVAADLASVKSARIVVFRNTFSAHSPNRGKGSSQHSFILDRHAMRTGSIEGYSANHSSGHLALKAKIMELLDGWDKILDRVFWEIGKTVYSDLLQGKV